MDVVLEVLKQLKQKGESKRNRFDFGSCDTRKSSRKNDKWKIHRSENFRQQSDEWISCSFKFIFKVFIVASKYSLGPVAWYLATATVNLHKSTKSDLLTSLEKKINLVNQISDNAARVYDCMCIIRQLPPSFDTFRDLSDCFLKRITSNSVALIFFTTDQYWKVSIKSCESTKQSRGESIRIAAMRPEQKLPKQ